MNDAMKMLQNAWFMFLWPMLCFHVGTGRLPSTHLNRDTIESNLSVPGIQGCHENTL